jgi:hypothetical protein
MGQFIDQLVGVGQIIGQIAELIGRQSGQQT